MNRLPARVRQSHMFGKLLRLIVLAGGVALAFQINSGIFAGLAVLFVLVAPFEKLYPRQKGQKIRRPGFTSDITFAMLNPLLNIASIIAVVIIGGLSLFWIPGLLVRPFVSGLPPVAMAIFGFLAFDFLGYWTHRWAHEVPFLWRFHAVHHSPEHMDWISGFRIHPFDGVLIAPPVFFLLAAGVQPEVTGVLAVFQILLGIFFHANVRLRLRWLDKIAANPEFHHWHHANEPDAIFHNYAASVPAWDLLFGTYFMGSEGRRPQVYGVNEYMPNNVIGQLTYPCRGARKHLALLVHPVVGFRKLRAGLVRLMADVYRSTIRPTRSATPAGSVVGPAAVPSPQPAIQPPQRPKAAV